MTIKSKPHRISLVVGDIGGDGHGKTGTHTISSNLPIGAVETAFEEGTKLLGFNLGEECRRQKHLPRDKWNKLADNGLTTEKAFMPFVDSYEKKDAEKALKKKNEPIALSGPAFTLIWLFIAQLGNKEFQWSFTEENMIVLGGYGLFDE